MSHQLLGSPLLDHNRATVMCFNRMRQQLLDAGHNNSNGSRFLALIEKTYGHPGWYWEILTLKQRENLVQVADWCWRNPYSGPLVRSSPCVLLTQLLTLHVTAN